MEEKARITGLREGRITLETVEKKECSGCDSCGRGKPRKTVFKTDNADKYAIGEEVILHMDTTRMMRLYLFLYGVPLCMFLIGSLGFYYLFGGAARAFAGGVFFTALAYVAVARYIKKSGTVKPEIKRIKPGT